MIYYDISESRVTSNLPQAVIDYGVPFDNLEQVTGADFVIVPEKSNYELVQELLKQGKTLIEISKQLNIKLADAIKISSKDAETVLHEWLFAGAILVQRKSGHDFLNSMGTRLNDAIARMCEVSHKQYQRIILVTGTFEHQANLLVLNSKVTNYNWKTYLGALSSIKYKGACVEFVNEDADILDWIRLQEGQLLKYKRDNTKWVVPTVYYPPDLPELDDPLQLMRPVRDARLAIVNIPGWGVSKVNALYEYVKKALDTPLPTLFDLLHYATSWETSNFVNGVGKGLIANARKFIGLGEGEYLWVGKGNVTVQKG